MRKRFYYLLIMLLLALGGTYAQIPVIQKIEPQVSFPKSRIVITGSGFSSTPAQLQVWFDQVRGTIIASSEFSIEVEVPAEARLSNITVINLVSRLSANSKLKFMPAFSGEGFDPTKLANPFSITSANAIFDIASADIDGDNKPDLIGSRFENTATTMVLLMNQSTVGNISFTNTNLTALNINAPTGHLAVGDLNGDGKPDVIASRSGTTANTIFILENTSTIGNPNFASPLLRSLEVTHFARQVAISDLNGDGKPEIVVANSASNDLYIFKNESAGGILTINSTPIKVTVTGATETLALELQDMDGDGKTDIVATRNQSQDIFVLKNTSTLSAFTFGTIFKITIPGQFNDLATADFNRDGKLDIVATSLFSAQVHVLLNKSSTTSFVFDSPITLSTDAQPFGIDVSDLNGDRFPDFIIPNRGTNTLNAYLHNGNISAVGFTKVSIPTNKTNWFVRAGDLDGDAKPDIAFTSFTNPSTFSVDILRNKNCHKPQILNEPPLTLCPSQTIRLVTIPIPGVTFDWSNGFSSIKNSADPFADVTVAATYTVTAKGEGTVCAVASAPIIIQSGAGSLPADPVITTNAPICSGSALSLSTPTVSGATYLWKGPNNFTSNLPNISIPGATVSNAGNYSLTLKSGDCSSNTVIKRVDIVSFGSFALSSSNTSNTICQGQNLTLTVNSEPGYSFQWIKDGANITGQTSATLSVTQGGSYKVKVTNTSLNCSQETAAVVATVFTAPVASFTLAATGCVNQAITFTSTSTVDATATKVFAWDFGDATTNALASTNHTYATSQTFNPKLTVSYSGVTGCTNSATKSINIAAGATPVITASKTEICPDESSTLTVTGTFNSFLWNTNATTSSIEVTTPGDYSVTTVDANGCQGSGTKNIATKTVCEPVTTDLEIPLVFTPNGDSQNDRWVIAGVENKGDCTMNVFDGRGRRIFQKTGYPVDGWDGSFDGKEVPEGTYYYVFSCPNGTPETGSVLIVR